MLSSKKNELTVHIPGGVETAMGVAAAGLVDVIVAMQRAIARLETELHEALAVHPHHVGLSHSYAHLFVQELYRCHSRE